MQILSWEIIGMSKISKIISREIIWEIFISEVIKNQPELPEVETVKESLKLRLNNKKIIKARVLWDNIIAYPSKDEFLKRQLIKLLMMLKEEENFNV